MRTLLPALALLGGLAATGSATAFCGFYVAKADSDLYTQASQVILARSGNTTVITMANDYQGDPAEFAAHGARFLGQPLPDVEVIAQVDGRVGQVVR